MRNVPIKRKDIPCTQCWNTYEHKPNSCNREQMKECPIWQYREEVNNDSTLRTLQTQG